jgi:glycosyltransferase involved in cell wall biosynthesis
MSRRVLCFYHRAETFGGSFNSVFDVLGRVDRRQFQPIVALPGPGNCQKQIEQLNLPVVFEREVAGSRTPRYAWSVAAAAWYLRRHAVALVYITDYVTWRSSALLAARIARVPSVVHVRAPLGSGVVDAELVKASVVVGNSEATIRSLRVRRRRPVRVIHNFIDAAPFAAASDIRSAFFPDRPPVIGFVGVFRPEKGIEYFLEMARLVGLVRPDVRFLAVGGESAVQDVGWFEKMRALARELGLDDRVHFTGQRTDVPDLMRSIDVLVVPSLNEGFGRVIVEANAAGVPAVGVDAAGIPEVIHDGITGALVPPRDAAAMASAVLRLLDDADLRDRMKRTLPEFVRQNFSPEAKIAQLEAAWRDALSGA